MLNHSDYQNALDSQSACNGGALVNALARTLNKITDIDTTAKNQHPIVILYLTQLMHLAGLDCFIDPSLYVKCLEHCQSEVNRAKHSEQEQQ